ncbi:MAG: hypothetical protein IH905_14550 [Proteobacteria bacterium]|nr:hypothetical protein [Pseudomonadota bacterium]
MRNGVIISGLLHLAIVLLAAFGLPELVRDAPAAAKARPHDVDEFLVGAAGVEPAEVGVEELLHPLTDRDRYRRRRPRHDS